MFSYPKQNALFVVQCCFPVSQINQFCWKEVSRWSFSECHIAFLFSLNHALWANDLEEPFNKCIFRSGYLKKSKAENTLSDCLLYCSRLAGEYMYHSLLSQDMCHEPHGAKLTRCFLLLKWWIVLLEYDCRAWCSDNMTFVMVIKRLQ